MMSILNQCDDLRDWGRRQGAVKTVQSKAWHPWLTCLAEKILQILPANVEWELEIAKIINTHAFVDGTIS